MKVLVTGAGGFLGLYVTEQLLARGDQVRTFSRRRYAAFDELSVESVYADLRDEAAVRRACEGVDGVIHTAGVAGIWGKWKYFHGINTLGTEHIVAGCRAHGVPRLVYSSSPSVTFAGSHQIDIDESAPYPDKWLCHYPHSKALAEAHVLAANSEQLRTSALRPHLIWGPRDQHLIPRLLDRARTGKLRRVGDGENLIDMIYVENAAAAHLQALDGLASAPERVGGNAYFISQGEPVNCWDWINEILSLAELPPVSKSISLPAARRIGAGLEWVYWLLGRTDEPRMTRFLAAQLATSHYFNIGAARRDFGYQPSIGTDEGMRRLAAAWQAGRGGEPAAG
ncbi:MAG: NAD-dependent epimerase/dehydratase family protein [Pirellulaceae bacterium]|nr:NAD-dependent epimerase/dehydratase family protein [Pirellulaceae bacterium]MDP7017969.1 NAD-dependent epimerase/dehydratase family protein [Pirellulaceae bacterium]